MNILKSLEILINNLRSFNSEFLCSKFLIIIVSLSPTLNRCIFLAVLCVKRLGSGIGVLAGVTKITAQLAERSYSTKVQKYFMYCRFKIQNPHQLSKD